MKLALISFDGLDPRIIYRNRDKLPTFDSLLEESMHGKWSTPGHTIPSFTATLTGEQYNVCNFHWDDGKGEYQRHRQTGFDYMWDLTDSNMTLLNIPVLYPPEDIDDAMVCGFLTPDSLIETNLAMPKDVQNHLVNEIGYIHDVNADETYDELGGEGMLEYLEEMMKTRAEAAAYLIDKFDSDLFYGVWTAPDRWFHQCHLHGEDYLPMYKMVDDILKKIIDLSGDTPTVVFSDHGFAHHSSDNGVHKGHMYEGFYSVLHDDIPSHRNDATSIFDLFPTVMNFLGEDISTSKGKVLFHTEGQSDEVRDRLDSLGYLE